MKNHHKILSGLVIVCLTLFSLDSVQAQTSNETAYTVTGTVFESNVPLPGVSIILQGAQVGTESDFEGRFEFPQKLNAGDVLVFSHLGMETQKITIKSPSSGSNIDLNVQLESDSYNLLGSPASKKAYSSQKN